MLSRAKLYHEFITFIQFFAHKNHNKYLLLIHKFFISNKITVEKVLESYFVVQNTEFVFFSPFMSNNLPQFGTKLTKNEVCISLDFFDICWISSKKLQNAFMFFAFKSQKLFKNQPKYIATLVSFLTFCFKLTFGSLMIWT